MYDPTVGRWLEEDPLGFEAEDVNLYRYVGNKSPMMTDPLGLDENIVNDRQFIIDSTDKISESNEFAVAKGKFQMSGFLPSNRGYYNIRITFALNPEEKISIDEIRFTQIAKSALTNNKWELDGVNVEVPTYVDRERDTPQFWRNNGYNGDWLISDAQQSLPPWGVTSDKKAYMFDQPGDHRGDYLGYFITVVSCKSTPDDYIGYDLEAGRRLRCEKKYRNRNNHGVWRRRSAIAIQVIRRRKRRYFFQYRK